MTTLCRSVLKELLGDNIAALGARQPHAGLLLTKGLARYPEKREAGEAKSAHVDRIAGLAVPPFYKMAYERWCQSTANEQRFASLTAALEGRLYIGVTRENPLETGVSVSHTYGIPIIPGSAVKGLCRACAGDWLGSPEARRWLFGNDPGAGDDETEIGGLIFHDAWWLPQGKPFVPETVTVHHPAYYGSQGRTAATDFDSPVPAPQIAVQGSFRFVIEGPPLWTRLAVRLLAEGLQHRGIGAKRSSGYGYFQSEPIP